MISIIIPVFNGAEWLAQAIESALIQSFSEVVVINDGSTDSSLKIAKRYPIKIISQVNKGLASARNTGIMNARGEYILPLDADDVLKADCCEVIEQVITAVAADVVAPSFKEFGLSNREVILMPNPGIEDFKTGNRIGYCSAIRRSALFEVGGYNPKMVEGYEDYDLWFDLLKRGKKIVTIPEILWMYRTKEKSMYTDLIKNGHHEKLMNQIKTNHPEVWE